MGKSRILAFTMVASSLLMEPVQVQAQPRPEDSRFQYLFALDLGYGGLSGGTLGFPSNTNTLQYSAYGLLGVRTSISGMSLAFGPYIESGFGRETGALSILGDRSARMTGTRYGVGTLARYGKYYFMGSLMFLGNLDLTGSSTQPKVPIGPGTGPDAVSFGGPFGFRLVAGMELKYGISLQASYTRKTYGSLTYTSVDPSNVPVTTTADTGNDPLVESNFALGISASY